MPHLDHNRGVLLDLASGCSRIPVDSTRATSPLRSQGHFDSSAGPCQDGIGWVANLRLKLSGGAAAW
jgi:hypothetical protein